jgi:hypothetical protein
MGAPSTFASPVFGPDPGDEDGDDDDDDDEAGAPADPDSYKTLSLLERPMTKADFDALTDDEKMHLHAELQEAGVL